MRQQLPATASSVRSRAWIAALVVVGLGLTAAACSSGSSSSGAKGADASDKTTTVKIELTPQGCAPKPATVAPGPVEFDITNKGADAVSEAELRTKDRAHILGEEENLTPGLSGSFTWTAEPGTYTIYCPGAATAYSPFTVTGKTTTAAWQSNPDLTAAVSGYSQYINQNVADLITHTQAFCNAVDAGDLDQAKVLYPPARIYYERIEPVAEIWGDLDVQIDGRWENPVTDASKFMGFHKLEELMWSDNTLAGGSDLCAGLLQHEQQLQTLVASAQYSPQEMAAGATDLINEAAANKITGEEERYSNTDLVDFQANVDGAQEVVNLLTPYLQKKDPAILTTLQQRLDAINKQMAQYQASPGYDNTGYVQYSTVLDPQRRQLSSAVNAYAEALSKISAAVS